MGGGGGVEIIGKRKGERGKKKQSAEWKVEGEEAEGKSEEKE